MRSSFTPELGELFYFMENYLIHWANPSSCTVYGVGLRPLTCWDWGFESRGGARILVPWECCVLSGTGLCVGLITRSEESYRVCVCVCVNVIVKPR
jgi:hypothetical protein